MLEADDPNWDVLEEWVMLAKSVQIRRWRAAQPQESSDTGDADDLEADVHQPNSLAQTAGWTDNEKKAYDNEQHAIANG
jgi:hypothetical protein